MSKILNGIRPIAAIAIIIGFALLIFNGYPSHTNWEAIGEITYPKVVRESAGVIFNRIIPGLGLIGLGTFLLSLNKILLINSSGSIDHQDDSRPITRK